MAGRVVPGTKYNEKTGYYEAIGGPAKRRDTSHFTK